MLHSETFHYNIIPSSINQLKYSANLITEKNFNFLEQVQSFGSCTTPGQTAGLCQFLRQCNSLYNLLVRQPLSDQDRNYLRRSQCGYTQGQVLVCCPDSLQQPTTGQLGGGRGLLPEPGTCGISTSDRIIGGVETQLDEYPWMALLQYFKPNNKKGFHCGGVLINSRYVLTASHCVNGKDIPTTWSLLVNFKYF